MMMAMVDRDRDRGPRGDAGAATSLWIDYVLLPERLEEHLTSWANGNLASPTPADLISMFLEQALISHKGTLGSSGAINKDAAPSSPGTSKMVGRTASLLCERAARVAVATQFSLFDIQTSIHSQQHQFMLLKALVKHDEHRSLIHECDLHRWILRNSLQTHPLGSAAPNATFPGPRAVVWVLGEDLTDPFKTLENGCHPAPGGGNTNGTTGEALVEEERPSLEFLEKVLVEEDEAAANRSALRNGHSQQQDLRNVESLSESNNLLEAEGSVRNTMSKGYRCQVMLDVAEVHFMRGRIQRAHELFTSCAELLNLKQHQAEDVKELSQGVMPELSKFRHTEGSHCESPVPKERLAGFIVACRMLLGTNVILSSGKKRRQNIKGIGLDTSPLLSLGNPSPAQRMVITCEQSRYNARQASQEAYTAEKLSRDNLIIALSSHKSMKIDPSEENPKALEPTTAFGQEEGAQEAEVVPGCLVSDYQMPSEEVSKSQENKMMVTSLSDGAEQGRQQEKQGVTLLETSVRESGSLSGESLETTPRRRISKVIDWRPNSGISLFSKEELGRNLLLTDIVEVTSDREGDDNGRQLVQIVVHDTIEGHLQWCYRLSLEKDPYIPVSVHCQLVACNLVRHIVERAPIQTFLGAGDTFEDSQEGVQFLILLMAAVKERFDELAQMNHNNIAVISDKLEAAHPRQGIKRKFEVGQSAKDFESLSAHVCDAALYICCLLDKLWCWKAALENKLISPMDIPHISAREPPVLRSKNNEATRQTTMPAGHNVFDCQDPEELNQAVGLNIVRGTTDKLTFTEKPYSEAYTTWEAILCALLHAENLVDVEELVFEVQRICLPSTTSTESDPQPQQTGRRMKPCQQSFLPSCLIKVENKSWRSLFGSLPNQGLESSELEGTEMSRATFATDAAAILRRRAIDALDIRKQPKAARRFYELARVVHPRDNDSMVMLWLLERLNPQEEPASLGSLEMVDGEAVLNFGVIEYVTTCLIEKEYWGDLSELCQWGLKLVKVGKSTEGENNAKAPGKGRATTVHLWHKRFTQTLKVAILLGDLMQLCFTVQAATGRNHFTEDVALMSSTMSQLFEDFLRLLVGADMDQGADEGKPVQSGQVALPPAYPGAQAVPLIPLVTNPRVLMSLASLMAGWLQRCNLAGLTPWPLAVERYGVLAGVTAGASLPPPIGSLPHAAPLFRPVPPTVAPNFGRDLFIVLLECIVGLPGVVEGDKEKGHRWLQGLADLAFEDEAYVKALQLYLQAGGIRSAYYCDRSSAMSRDIFTPWVLRRMVAACRAIGASVQAAVLCQCLPVPDHESAFRILQENSLIVVRDAAAYFDCVWEVPILELLVYMHAKSGDEERVSALIALLQQPALNVHNPQSIRLAHVATLEQRFLQRLCGELL